MLRRFSLHFAPRLIALCMFVLFVFLAEGPFDVARAASTVTINPSQQYQTLQGWGSSMAWWANWVGGLSDSQRNALADALFDPNKGIGLNVLRYNFGADGPGNVCHNSIASGKAGIYTNIPTYEPSAGTYDWTQDANQRWVLQAAQNRGANLFEGFVNSPPAWMLTNSCTSGASGNAENLSSAHYDDYASYLATIAQHFHDSWGLTLQTLEPFNEPTPGYWNYQGDQEGTNVSTATQNTIVNKVGARLDTTGISAYSVVSTPDDTAVNRSNTDYNAYDSTAKGYVVQYNTHTYGGSDSDRDYAYSTIGQGGNKRLWMSEWGTGSQGSQIASAITLSQHILDDEQHLHPAAWVIWQAADNYFGAGGSGNSGANDDLWGLASTDSNGNIIYPSRYYGFGNYTKFIRPGYKMIGNSDGSTFSAYDAGSRTLVLVATNSGSSSNAVTYNLSNFTSVGGTATPYQTTASANLAQLANMSISNKSFTASLPGQSITTFVIPNVSYTGTNAVTEVDDSVQGSGTNQFNYQGSGWGHCTNCGSNLYNSSDSWDGQAGDSVSLQFTGSRIRLYGVKDTNEGIGLVSIDNGPAHEVDFYAAQRAGNQFMWESPALSSGTHTFKLSVAGRKNPQSTNVWPALDRVEIDPVATGYVKIVNRNSGKALDVTGQSTSDGALLEQWDYWGGANQQWQLVDAGGGYVKIVSRNSGKLVDVSQGSTADGASAIQYTDNGGANQQWQLVDVGGGYVKIVNRNSGKVLDVSGQSTSNGGSVIQYTYNGGANQQWQVLSV